MSTNVKQHALNKTPDELANLSDDRLNNVMKAARKAARYPSPENDPVEQANQELKEARNKFIAISQANVYYDSVKAECDKRPHFKK